MSKLNHLIWRNEQKQFMADKIFIVVIYSPVIGQIEILYFLSGQ